MTPMLQPSCPVLVVHDDDAFRKTLIAALDQHHFTVTYSSDGDGAVDLLSKRKFPVILVGLNLQTQKGVRALEYLRENREAIGGAVIILGDPDPNVRTFAPWADETMLKPVDAAYVAQRARVYCT